MSQCRLCKIEKPDGAFTWNDTAHTHRDVYCKACRAALRRRNRKPNRKVAPPTLPYQLSRDTAIHLSPTEAAYVAALLDGEGCIHSGYPDHGNNRLLCIIVTMVHRPTIEWLKEKCGGLVYPHQSNQKPARTAWCWQVKAARSHALLKAVRPYMITKADEADVAIELAGTIWNNQVRGRVTEETLARRRELGATLKALKHREWK
jgi:hypothetical protein